MHAGFVTEGQGSQSPCMGSAASKQKDVPLTPAPAPVCFTSDQYCMGHHVTLTLQKKKRSKRRLSAIWYGRMQKLSVEDPDGKTIFEVHRASWTFASRTSLLDPHHRTILKFVRPFGLQPTWKIKAESRRGRDQAVIVRRPVFAARPQVKVYLPAAIKPSGVTAGEPDFTVSANIATKDLVVYSVGGGRRPAVAQLVCSGAEEGRDGLLRVAANMDVALVLAIFLASDALLYAGLMQT
ncbi:unnamed protein product [Ostreobium quekettii]|uniref:Uncharacterized protein n=1 Tax=Ostreobium quekettii TaxID=121088 RepID=A0A8S1J2X1_9CHLO|nr:unnamed protein product [Ostreobium quekettii]